MKRLIIIFDSGYVDPFCCNLARYMSINSYVTVFQRIDLLKSSGEHLPSSNMKNKKSWPI